jgi:hypothetical protein
MALSKIGLAILLCFSLSANGAMNDCKVKTKHKKCIYKTVLVCKTNAVKKKTIVKGRKLEELCTKCCEKTIINNDSHNITNNYYPQQGKESLPVETKKEPTQTEQKEIQKQSGVFSSTIGGFYSAPSYVYTKGFSKDEPVAPVQTPLPPAALLFGSSLLFLLKRDVG